MMYLGLKDKVYHLGMNNEQNRLLENYEHSRGCESQSEDGCNCYLFDFRMPESAWYDSSGKQVDLIKKHDGWHLADGHKSN